MTKPGALLVFGDSLSDAGRAYDLTGRVVKVPIPPNSAGYNGWFSNGLIQSKVTAELLALPAEVYAVGGARAVGSRTVEQYLEQSGYDTPEIMLANPDPLALATDGYLGGQLRHYLFDAVTNPPEPGTVAALWFGANDYNALPLDASPELVRETIAAVVGNIVGAAAAIASTGVARTLLYNLPAPEFLPLPLPPTFGLVVDAHNAALAEGAAFLASQGIDAEIVDMHRIAGEISADPRTFGLNPAYMDQPLLLGIGSQPTWIPETQNWFIRPNPVVAGANPSQVAFADLLHPSSATHGVLGIFVADFLSKDPTFLDDGNDARWFGPADDFVLGGGGNDLLFTRGGQDTVLAGIGNDVVFAGGGDDIAAGGAGRDRVDGGARRRRGGRLRRQRRPDRRRRPRPAGRRAGVRPAAGRRRPGRVPLHRGGADRRQQCADGGDFTGGFGRDILYLALSDATRAAVEAELAPGAGSQRLDSIGIVTASIERYVFVDPADPAAGIDTPAELARADLWGIV